MVTRIKFVYGSAGVVLTANVTKRTKKAYFVAIEKLHGTGSEDKVLKRTSSTTVLAEFRVPNDKVLKEWTEESRMEE